jgi:hypothetical protein
LLVLSILHGQPANGHFLSSFMCLPLHFHAFHKENQPARPNTRDKNESSTCASGTKSTIEPPFDENLFLIATTARYVYGKKIDG